MRVSTTLSRKGSKGTVVNCVVFRIVLYMSEQSLEFNRTPESQYIPGHSRVDTSLPAHYRPGTCATYSVQTAYRENLPG